MMKCEGNIDPPQEPTTEFVLNLQDKFEFNPQAKQSDHYSIKHLFGLAAELPTTFQAFQMMISFPGMEIMFFYGKQRYMGFLLLCTSFILQIKGNAKRKDVLFPVLAHKSPLGLSN